MFLFYSHSAKQFPFLFSFSVCDVKLTNYTQHKTMNNLKLNLTDAFQTDAFEC